jgi:hypothetical protein
MFRGLVHTDCGSMYKRFKLVWNDSLGLECRTVVSQVMEAPKGFYRPGHSLPSSHR